MLFESWDRVAAVVGAGVAVYVFLVALLRVSGKRTLAKLSAFDFVVTIALGSVLASVIVSDSIPLVDGLAALAVLVLLQVVVATAVRRWPWAAGLAKARPTALVLHGEIRHQAAARCRVQDEELAAAVREHGRASFAEVACVVLETDGSFSVMEHLGDGSALRGVEGIEPPSEVASERG